MKMQVRLLGVPEVHVAGKLISGTYWERIGAQRLFFALLLNESHRITRDELCKQFWPALQRASARVKLTNTLHGLRRALGHASERLIATGDSIELMWDDSIEFDVEQFELRLDAAACCAEPMVKLSELQEALDIYRGPLMDGWPVEPWIAQDGEVLKARYLWALDQVVGIYESRSLPSDAIRFQRLRVAASATDATAQIKLLTLLLDGENIDEVSATYNACRDALTNNLGAAPSQIIQGLCERIKQRTASSRNTPAALSATGPALTRDLVATSEISGPIQELELLGRDRDLNLLFNLLAEASSEDAFVTITGLGGVGKTSVARHLMNRWPQDRTMRFLDFSEIDSVEAAAEQIKNSLALPLSLLENETHGAPREGHEHIDGLVVIDNFEHLVAHASVVSTLRERCPRLTVLVTSRIPLRLPTEIIYPLSPLDVRSSAIELFVRRARKQNPKIKFNDPELLAAADVCKLLDGLPLAIELAAARTRLFEPAELATRLETDLKILRRTGDPLASNRRDSLWAILAWSVNLLGPSELALLLHLTAFQGGFDISAVQAVCPSAEENALDLFQTLIDHQLVVEVQVEHVAVAALNVQKKLSETPRRWNLLETVRQYVATLVEAAAPVDSPKSAHAQYFMQEMAIRLKTDANSTDTDKFFVIESHNVFAALEYRFAANPIGVVAPLLQALDKLRFNGHWFAITRWIKRLRELSPQLLDTDQQAQLDVLTLINFNCNPENKEVNDASQRLVRLIESGATLTETLQLAVANIATATAAKGQPSEALRYVDGIIEQAESRRVADQNLSVLHAIKIRLETSSGRWSDLAVPIETLVNSLASAPEALFYVERALATRQAMRGDHENCLLVLQRLTARSTWPDHQADLQIHAVMFAHHALKPALARELLSELENRNAAKPSFDSKLEFDIVICALSVGLLNGERPDQKAALAMNRLHSRMQSGAPLSAYYSEHFWYLRSCLHKDHSAWLGSALSALATSGIRYPFIWATHFTELLGIVATALRNQKAATDCFLFSQDARALVGGSLSPLERQARIQYGVALNVGSVGDSDITTPLESFSGANHWERLKPHVIALRDTALSSCDPPKFSQA